MKHKEAHVLLVDDDPNFVFSIAPQLMDYLKSEKRAKLIVFGDESAVDEYLASTKDSPSLAIIDLWMQDRETGGTNRQAGQKIISRLRKKWPNLYIIILSNHIDRDVRKEMASKTKLAMLDKTIPTRGLTYIVDEKIGR